MTHDHATPEGVAIKRCPLCGSDALLLVERRCCSGISKEQAAKAAIMTACVLAALLVLIGTGLAVAIVRL